MPPHSFPLEKSSGFCHPASIPTRASFLGCHNWRQISGVLEGRWRFTESLEEVGDDWISVAIDETTATSLVLAVLRQAKEPLPAKEVVEMVTHINPHIPRGSINNIGTWLARTIIHRTDEGWRLLDPPRAGIICDGYLWGPKGIFDKQEIAAHRREAILQILRAFPSGLQTVQFVDQLRATPWVHAPASKDLVKADMELLEGYGKVRKISNSRKWCLSSGG